MSRLRVSAVFVAVPLAVSMAVLVGGTTQASASPRLPCQHAMVAPQGIEGTGGVQHTDGIQGTGGIEGSGSVSHTG